MSFDIKTDVPKIQDVKNTELPKFDSKLDVKDSMAFWDKVFESAESVGDFLEGKIEKFNQYFSTYKERLAQTPSDNGERGEWQEERGESRFIPNSEEIKEILSKFGLNGIKYTDAIPDFSKCSECTLEIDNMTAKREENFKQCDEKCADHWNKEGKDGKIDWTARDVAKWREDNKYSWHERNDMKTCDLVPTRINDYFGHAGGVSECRKRDANNEFGGIFDE